MYPRVWESRGVQRRFSAIRTSEPQGLREIGYDLTAHTSKGLDAFNGKEVELAVTMGCGDECPLILAKRRVDWKIPDPRDMTPDQFREVRNMIESKVKELLDTL